MRIGIEATAVAQHRIVGISRFARRLAEEFAATEAANEYYLYYRPSACRHPSFIWRPGDDRFHVRFLQEPFNRGSFRRLDVFHATYQRLPAYRDLVPFLGSLHDVFHLSVPDSGSNRIRHRWQARYRDVAARARLIMTLSEFSRAEIVRLLGADPATVRVIPLAPSPAYVPCPPAEVASVRSRYGIREPYVLFGGGFSRRKNVLGALRAFARALADLPPAVSLLISGSGGRLESKARAFVRERDLGRQIRFLGFVPEPDYPGMISGCLFYFFPSLFEGFGLPALEAMSCAAPLLTASTTSLPEVCGDAALLVDPADEGKLVQALLRLAHDERLRDTLRERGLRRAREYTWQRVAERVLCLYREIAACG